jgi:3-oxoadipate enol-lactonase
VFIELNGVRHHYVSKGEGPPIVLLHALGGSLHAWHGVTENLSLHHHVVGLDLRGHGRSDHPKGAFSIKPWAGDVEALIGALELPAVTLVGHSLSSLVAQQLAVTNPEMVDNLVLAGGISYFEPPAKESYAKRAEMVEADGMDALVDDWLPGALAPRTQAKLPQLVGLLRELFLRNDPAAYAAACRAIAEDLDSLSESERRASNSPLSAPAENALDDGSQVSGRHRLQCRRGVLIPANLAMVLRDTALFLVSSCIWTASETRRWQRFLPPSRRSTSLAQGGELSI